MGKKTLRGMAAALLAVCAVALLGMTGCTLEEAMYPRNYRTEVSQSAKDYRVEEALVYAVIKAESNFNPNAVSHVGAVGLMQIMPGTAEWLLSRDNNTELSIDDFYDPAVNIRYGVQYLSYLSTLYDNLACVVAAYNAGPGNVDSWLQNPDYSSDGVTLHTIPFPETEHYVQKVQAYYEKYQELYG